MTHRFTNCTFDLRGVDYACVSRGDEFEIGHIGEGERVLIDGDTLDFTGLHILGPVALAERIKVAVELECKFLTTERGSLRTEIDTLRDELAKARSPFNPPNGQIDANLWFWRCRAEMLEEFSGKRLEEAKAMRDAAMKATRNAEREVEAMGRTISKLQEKLAAYEVKT